MTKDFYDYVVYSDGRVFSNYSNKFLKPSENRDGYLTLRLYYDGKPHFWFLHRLVATLYIDNPNNLPQINHKDGNKSNNDVSNLEWCDSYYNNKHARNTGLNDVSKSNRDRWCDPEFRERTSKRMSESINAEGRTKGHRNGRWRYDLYWDGNPIERKDLPNKLNCSQSNADRVIALVVKGKLTVENLTVIDTKKSIDYRKDNVGHILHE